LERAGEGILQNLEGRRVSDAAGEPAPTRPQLRVVEQWPVKNGFYEKWIKAGFDRLVGVMASIVTIPIVAVIATAIAWNMGTPVIYRQRRVGLYGREFTVYKFRTMLEDRRTADVGIVDNDRRVNHKSQEDPRHTNLGRFLRRWSLDEIPQFWNLALGDMSLVGPRPELPSIVAKYEPWQHQRHAVRPGLTGLWQISERGTIPMHEATDIDIAYVENVTLGNDLRIVIATPAAAFGSNRGQ
jgi:lipopolysaccharide/colanic/teichoic acid biosynthesis glycosyltransferase